MPVITWLCALCSVAGDVTWTSGFADGLETAARRSVPLVVFVHGSDWNRQGERIETSVWRDRRTRSRLEDSKLEIDAVFTDVDVLQSPTPEQLDAFEVANAGWKGQGLITYPAFIAFLPDGTVLGSRQGETLPRETEAARDALVELARSAAVSHDLRERIEEVGTEDRAGREIELIHQLTELPLDPPVAFFDRLGVIDPDDASGIRRRATLPPWHTMIAEATKDAKEGRAKQALERLGALLEDSAYTDAQRAWVLVAIGAVHRNSDAPEAEAAESFRNAWSLDPGGIAGNAGMRWYLRFYSDPTLLFGWTPSQCSSELVSWKIEDLPAELSPGTWIFTADYTKGPHGLEIVEVALVDGAGNRVAVDTHEGFTGTRDRQNTWRLELRDSVSDPHLLIRCRTDGGTNSHGNLLFEPLQDS